MQSCKDCPSFVNTDDAIVIFRRATGAPMCAKYGYVLGRPGLSESGTDKAQQSFALNCDSFGQPRPDKPVDTRTRVVDFDAIVIARGGDPSFVAATLPTCRQCKNLVKSDVVQAELGYPNDLCRAKGKLIIRPQSECQGCPWAEQGPQSTTCDGLEVRAEFRDGFVLPSEKVVGNVTGLGNTTDEPTTYETDKPVSDEDAAMGVRAWRRVQDPEGHGEDGWLPILRPDLFDDDELSRIPVTGDDHHPELYVDYAGILYSFAIDVVRLNEILVLQGKPGTGKTEAAYWLAWLMQVPFYRFSYHGDMDVDALVGMTNLDVTTGTHFDLGRIPKTFMRPSVVVHDELNLAPDEVREMLRPTFDNAKQLVVEQAAPAIYCPRDPFHFPIIAQNPSWDMRNIGTKEMALADYDRLSVQTIPMPPEAIERHIIRTKVLAETGWEIPEDVLTTIMGIAEDIREFEEQGAIPFSWGIRQQIKVAKKARFYRLPKAYRRAALDFYEESVVEDLLQAISTRIDGDDGVPF